jgi:hypothetical protein
MDIGKKCLIMGIVGALLAAVSSPLIIYMVFTGRFFEALVEKTTLKPYPPNVFQSGLRIINNRTIFPYTVLEFTLSPEQGREQYRVILNVETNGTIHTSISIRNNTLNIMDTFNSGNNTRELQVTSRGIYVLNVTGIGSEQIGAKFKVIESWYYAYKNWVPEIDLLRTLGGPAGFTAGIAMLIGSLVKLRKAAREARPTTTEKTAARRRYLEVEEEEY